jgi:SsrA-binding protein
VFQPDQERPVTARDPHRTKDLLVNRRARFEYELVDTWEAGVALLGSEVKSIKNGLANLQEAWVQIRSDGAWLHGCHVSPYVEANRQNHEPLRARQLLLHQSELQKLSNGTRRDGMTIVPVRFYLKGSRIKLEIALARGKKLHDKRSSIKDRDLRREMDRDG